MPKDESLISFINKTSPEKLQVEEDLGNGFVRLNISEAQKRQARQDIRSVEDSLVELLRNSRDANARNIYIASSKEKNLRNVVVIDDGDGIPQNLHSKIFEPRVTSKLDRLVLDSYGVHGRGMALFGIAQNCLISKVAFSDSNTITAINIVADTAKLPEKANQSTWPRLDARGQLKDGPKNLIRHALEFNIVHPNLNIYLGSPSQILATLQINPTVRLQNKKAQSLYKFSKDLGLEVSFRNCQRVSYKEIETVRPLLLQINYKPSPPTIKKGDIASLISKEDLELLLEEIKTVVDKKVRNYFLTVSQDANINRVGNKLKINLPLEIKE